MVQNNKFGMEQTEKVHIGIMSQAQIRERMLAIAKGVYKLEPDEPKIWFTSMRSLAEAFSDENRALLRIIQRDGTRFKVKVNG